MFFHKEKTPVFRLNCMGVVWKKVITIITEISFGKQLFFVKNEVFLAAILIFDRQNGSDTNFRFLK